jgi:hypothetical protein
LSSFVALSAGALPAQIPIPRANVEIDAARVFPVDCFKTEKYSTGPGLRVGGGEFRLHRNLVAEGGWTGAGMATYYNCSSFGCSSSRLENKFLDYGLRGVLPLAGRASYLLEWAAAISGSIRPPVTTITPTSDGVDAVFWLERFCGRKNIPLRTRSL